LEPLAFRSPLWHVHQGDATDPTRISWTIPHRKRGCAVVTLNPGRHRGLVVLNDVPIRFFDQSGPVTIYLDEDTLGRGASELQLAILGDAQEALEDLRDAASLLDCDENLTAKAEWAFAKWEPPAADEFEVDGKRHLHVPRWWRTTFTAGPAPAPLWLDTASLSKGQVYVNGRHLGRYFTASADGKRVTSQAAMMIPAAWLKPGATNDVSIFDEHGFSPAEVRITSR
jgi:hypothetical protein